MDATDIKQGMDVRVRGFRGAACYVSGFPQRWEPYLALMEDEEGNECWVDIGEGEWVSQGPECGRVIIRMHGDDVPYEVDVEDCEPLPEEAFCASCGQIGCCADGR